MENGENLSHKGHILSCALEDLFYESTSLDAIADVWDYPDFCALSKLRIEIVTMVKQTRSFKLSVELIPLPTLCLKSRTTLKKHFGNLANTCPTNYDVLYSDNLNGGFDVDCGRNLGPDENERIKILQKLRLKEKSDCGQIFAVTRTRYHSSVKTKTPITNKLFTMGRTIDR